MVFIRTTQNKLLFSIFTKNKFEYNLVPRIFLWERPWLRLVTCLIKNLAPEGVWGKYQITSTCFQCDIRKKHKFCELLRSKYLLIFVYFLCFEFTRTFLHSYLQSSQEAKQIVTRSALRSCCYSMHALFTLERGYNKRLL